MGAGGNYQFRGIDDVYNALCGLTADAGLAMYPRVVDKQIDYQTNAHGKVQTHYHLTMDIDIVSAVDNSERTIRSLGEAIDSGDKGSGKAQSYAYKMATLMAFMIPTHGEMDTEAYAEQTGPAFVSANAKSAAPVYAQPTPVQHAQQVELAVAEKVAANGGQLPEAPARRTRGPNKPKPDPVVVPTPEAPFPHGAGSATTNDVDALIERIASVNTFPLLFAMAQDAESSIPAHSADKAGVFEVIKSRALKLFSDAADMATVQQGFNIVRALGEPAELKAAANAAYARYR
jgi:hypothetical protein